MLLQEIRQSSDKSKYEIINNEKNCVYIKQALLNKDNIILKRKINFDVNIKEDENIITIALLGTDFSQNEKYGNLYGASDSTMILGIDKKNNKIKLFSLMRDMYLDLPDGSGKQNLNYTMAYGGPELILKTINTNFNL